MTTRISESLEHELEQLNDEILRLDNEAGKQKEAADKLVSDIKESGVNPLTDKEAFDQVDEAYVAYDSLRDEAAELRTRREKTLSRLGKTRSGHSGPSATPTARGWAAAVHAITSTPEYQRLKEIGAFESGKTRIELPGVEIMSRDEAVRLLQSMGGAIGHATADVDAMVEPDQRLFPPVGIPVRRVMVTDMITMTTTDSDQVDYVVETTRTDAAAETAPGVASPEATYAYEAKTAAVRDISHFTAAHKRNLADEGQIRGLLEGRLRSGVERRFETQIISGDGTGQNLLGILNTEGISTVARGLSAPERRLEALHRGITAVRLALEDEPTAIGLHPSDYEEVIFEKDENGAYLLGPASQQTSRTVWGFPTAISSAFPEDTGLVGDFKTGAIAWLRSGVALAASDSHSDFFTKRMVALLAELRAAFAVWQPKAFCEVTDL